MILVTLATIVCLVPIVSSRSSQPGHSNDLVINEYQSKLDLTGQTPFEKISLQVTNKSPSQINRISILVPSERVVVSSSVEDAYGQPLTLVKTEEVITATVDGKTERSFQVFEIRLQNPISPEYDFKISSLMIYYKSFYVFYPKKIDLFEDQKVKAIVYKVPASVYPIERVELELTMGDALKRRRDSFEAQDVSPLSPQSQIYQFVLNVHFVQSSKTTRYIEISHWGNIYFNDEYFLKNRGAKFRGAFSTLDFNKGRKDTGRTAFREETIRLPVNAWGLFYRDEIGNISTSQVTRSVSASYVGVAYRCHSQAEVCAARRLELHLVPFFQRAYRRHTETARLWDYLQVRVPGCPPVQRDAVR